MNHQYPAFLSGSQASLPDAAVLASVLVTVVIDVALIFYCLDDLNRREIVIGDKRWWAAVIILGGPVGQIVYMLYGRGPY
jgi:hypothetical protein